MADEGVQGVAFWYPPIRGCRIGRCELIRVSTAFATAKSRRNGSASHTGNFESDLDYRHAWPSLLSWPIQRYNERTKVEY